MPITLLEQLQIDKPAGIRNQYQTFFEKLGNQHEAEHRMMAQPQKVLATAQANDTARDDVLYIFHVKRLIDSQ